MDTTASYSVPVQAEALFWKGILENPLMGHLPQELRSLGRLVDFDGNSRPLIMFNWRWAESIAALKALEATMLNHLLTRKYGIDPVRITINTDHSSCFIMSTALARVVEEKPAEFYMNVQRPPESLHRMLATGLYKTCDNRFYHIHGSLNPDQTLTALALPLEGKVEDNFDDVVRRIQNQVSKFDSVTLDERMNSEYRQAGTTVMSSAEYFATSHGQQSGKIGLYELSREPSSMQPPSWWPENDSMRSSPKRPLAGLRVVDLTRVIAGPTITASLAEMGASVLRITGPHIIDFPNVFHDLNWGKWNAHLDLRQAADQDRLRSLISDADVVVDGYRPGVMERFGFGRTAIFDLVNARNRGIVHVRENCYGWHGPWASRSGWQGISDACCGISTEFGRAMGLNEPVTPPFPNSDRCTGVIGCAAVLHALVERAERGGSYGVDASLNYYSQWLVRSCGTYEDSVWNDMWATHGSPVFRHYDNTRKTVPAMLQLIEGHNGGFDISTVLQEYNSVAVGITVSKVKPVARYENDTVELRYNIGARGNGVDNAVWPEDLGVEVIR
ncbi:CoA-transferase family III domain-containing protein [Xylaria sp. FL0933]|nr:CoA-transferase family III domain-containing protein [Xylaria sp. FL0933]